MEADDPAQVLDRGNGLERARDHLAGAGTLRIFGQTSFDDLTWTLNDSVIRYGTFLTALLNFLIIAATLFVIIRAFEEMQKRRKGGAVEEDEDEKSDEVVLLAEIRDLLRERQA